MSKSMKFKCSLCEKKFKIEQTATDHLLIHKRNNKTAIIVPLGTEREDYSDAEYDLHSRFGI